MVVNHDVPGVIPTPETTWFQIAKVLTPDMIKDVNKGLIFSVKAGNISLIEYYITKGADHWNWAMTMAARGGHKNLVEFFINKGANNWNLGLKGAVEGGHKDLVEFFISKGANNSNYRLDEDLTNSYITILL